MRIRSKKERRFNVILAIVMVVIMLITVYPVWYCLINSLDSAEDIAKNGFCLTWPRMFSLESWQTVLKDSEIFRAFGITVARTVLVTVGQTLITSMFAYGFSRNNLRGKRFYTVIGFASMYLNGGVIAYFILFNAMHIYNTFWVYVIPCLFGGFYNVIIFNANFKAIPEALIESAKIDGASEYSVFFKIVFPLSKPVLTALGIFTAVGTWNDYTQTLYYTRSTDIQTLSYYMLSITKSSAAAETLMNSMTTSAGSALTSVASSATNYRTIELSCMILSAIPLIVIYPFAQKFFESGVMVGSVKE